MKPKYFKWVEMDSVPGILAFPDSAYWTPQQINDAWNKIELSTDPCRVTEKEKSMKEVIGVTIATCENGYIVTNPRDYGDNPRGPQTVFESFDGLTAHLRERFNVDAAPATPTKRK